jgi:hypothetical protein
MTPEKINLNPQNITSYCPELWSRAYISQQNNQFAYKPCCYFRPDTDDTIKDFTNVYDDLNNKHQIYRTKSLRGEKISGCDYCYNLEKSIAASPRSRAIENYKDSIQLISHIDLNLGNLCNLSCAICGPFNSSSWVPIAEKGWHKVDATFKYRPHDRPEIDDPKLFLQLKTIQLQGGEIFLEDGYQKFFENLGKYRTYSDLSIMIFTNGTVTPKQKFVDILNQCGDVKIFFSVDDIEQRFEYQRRGAKWNEVVKNIHWFEKNLRATLGFNITYSLFNIFYLDQVAKKLSELFPSFYRNYSAFNTGMADCSAQFVNHKHYKTIIDKLAGFDELDFISNYLQSTDSSYKEFKEYVKKYDKITSMSYPNTHPEFWNLINN